MRKRLLNNFIRKNGWLLMILLATVRVVASVSPTIDTCRNPDPPIIIGSAKVVCRFQPVSLSATGCSGTVIWSNGSTGNTIIVQPQQTTKYTAICRAQPGCISCFAEVWKVTVNTPEAPIVTSSATLACLGDVVTIQAQGCSGTVRWTDQAVGQTRTDKPQQTTSYQAVCEQNGCVSNPSIGVAVQIAQPSIPVVSTDQTTICAGQTIRLTASTCPGTVHWSNGITGFSQNVNPYQTRGYKAICQVGSCRSDSSASVVVTVRPLGAAPALVTTLTNGCPFQTADLSKAIPQGNTSDQTLHYIFHVGNSPTSPPVQSPGAVLAGTYYVIGRDTAGCYTTPVAISVRIGSCPNAIAPCLSNPASVAILLDSVDRSKGIIRLRGQFGGSASGTNWQSSGGGLFTDSGPYARYLLSETDRQRGSATFTLSTADPDGNGPCVGATTQLLVSMPITFREFVRLNRTLNNPAAIPSDSVRIEEGQTVFIPEGFSPNGDGINDRFVIQRLPVGVTVQLEIFNRWGAVVYKNDNYRNDWDGSANQGSTTASTQQGLPDGTYFYQVRLSDGREFVRFLTLAR